MRHTVLRAILLLLIVVACVACGNSGNAGDGSGDSANPCRLNPNASGCQQGGGNDHSEDLLRQQELEREKQKQEEENRLKY